MLGGVWAIRRKDNTMSHDITIRPILRSDLEFAQHVRALAGWNQTRADWRRLLRYQPDGCFLAELTGWPAGTATAICYGASLGWIGMVLVDPESRRKGVATALMEHAMEFLSGRVVCIKLDATPDGQRVYERLGFQVEYSLTRWQRADHQSVPCGARCPPLTEADWSELVRDDAVVFGVERSRLLRMLDDDSLATCMARNSNGSIESYGMARTGARAAYIGPVVSLRGASAAGVIHELIERVEQDALYWDIPDDNLPAIELAMRLGFSRQRPLVRMWHGRTLVKGNTCGQWAIAGPAVG